MDTPPKKARSRKEQMQLDRARWLDALQRAVVDPETGLTPITFFVVWTLVTRFHNDGDGAFPSHQTLADATALGVKAVRVHLDLAVAAGFLTKRRVGRMEPNVYFMDLAILQGVSERAPEPDQSGRVIGSRGPVSPASAAPAEGVVSGHSVQVIGPAAPSDRARQSKVIGPVGPTNHVVDNHEEEPRRATRDARPGARTRPSSSDSNPDSDSTSDAGDVSDDDATAFT